MNAAKVEKSPRLQRILRFLRERGKTGATSLEIVVNCKTVAPATDCSELRKNGFKVECFGQGKNADGARVFRYWLIEPGQRTLFSLVVLLIPSSILWVGM